MNAIKRRLLPIALAIPTLLAISSSASWYGQTTQTGTGFYATYYPSDIYEVAQVAYYNPPGQSVTLYQYSGSKKYGESAVWKPEQAYSYSVAGWHNGYQVCDGTYEWGWIHLRKESGLEYADSHIWQD